MGICIVFVVEFLTFSISGSTKKPNDASAVMLTMMFAWAANCKRSNEIDGLDHRKYH